MSKAAFDFTSLRGENLAEIAADHETKTIDIQATDDASIKAHKPWFMRFDCRKQITAI